jgi:hypothetical protein
LKKCFGVLYCDDNRASDLKFDARTKKNLKGHLEICFKTDKQSYSASIAGKMVLHMPERDLYIIPLPHTSNANNKYWKPEDWDQLNVLIEKVELTRFSGRLISFIERSPKWETKSSIQPSFASRRASYSDRGGVRTTWQRV